MSISSLIQTFLEQKQNACINILYTILSQKENPPSHTPGKWRIKSNSISQVLYFIRFLGHRGLTPLSQAHLFLLYKLPCLLLRKGKLLHNFLYNSLPRGAHLSQHFNKSCDSTFHSLFKVYPLSRTN